MTMTHTSTDDQAGTLRPLVGYLAALVGREPNGLLEVRWRHNAGMHRRVFRVRDEFAAAAAEIVKLGARTDVYVGCAPRRRRPGGLDALARVWVLWVDCDTPAAVAALQQFSPAPAIIVKSGTAEHRHAYWTLQGPLSTDQATTANRRLAHALGADGGAVTTAAAILRPPGTQNFKHQPPTPVIAKSLQPWRRVSAHTLVDELADPPAQPPPAVTPQLVSPARARFEEDGLREIAPAVYVRALTGLTPGRDGKVSCPFHGRDSTPSLHVYSDPAEGWYCFGCGRGGSIFDLGAEVYGLSTRGPDFIALRRRLRETLSAWAPETTGDRER